MNHYELSGRVAIITGGARGIGLAVARRARNCGAEVVLWDLLDDPLAKAAAALPATTARVDVTDASAVADAAAAVLALHGRIDILVNSAGITGPNHPTWDYPPEDFERVVRVNLLGTFHCCRAIAPAMRAAGRGRIINLASLAGKEGTPNASAYSASKAAVIALTKSLAKELAQSGVIVNCIAPAAAATEMLAQMTNEHVATMLSKSPMGRFVEADEIAAMIAWMASDECSFTTGAAFDCSGGRAVY